MNFRPTPRRACRSPGSPSLEHPYVAAALPVDRVVRRLAELAADLTTANRFQAARAAALAGTESGRRGLALQSLTREHAGAKQALDWLKADLTASAALLNAGTSQQQAAVLKRLGRWQVDPALAGIRDEPELAGIPEPERRSLRDLWRRIEALRAKRTAPDAPGSDFDKKT